MLDMSAEATLANPRMGIGAIEMMGGPMGSFAGLPTAEGGPGGGGRGAGGPGGPIRRPRRARRHAGGASARGAQGYVERHRVSDSRAGRRARRRRRWRWTRPRRDDGRTAGGAAGTGRQGEGLAHQRLDGPLQEAAQDVQRRRRDHLATKMLSAKMSDESTSTCSTSPRRWARIARRWSCDRRRAVEARRRLRDEEEIYRLSPHAQGGVAALTRRSPCPRATRPTSIRPLGGGRRRRRHADAVPGEAPDHIGSFHLKDRTTRTTAGSTSRGARQDANQGNPADGEEEQVGPSRIDRDGMNVPEGSDAVKEVKMALPTAAPH